ncbi:MAG TPA: hypothetical protein ENI99_00920 [Sedimenticola sp.]|nr:hypothetical protein [Sedimenticola sp.]
MAGLLGALKITDQGLWLQDFVGIGSKKLAPIVEKVYLITTTALYREKDSILRRVVALSQKKRGVAARRKAWGFENFSP